MSIPSRENALRRLPWALAASACLHGAALSWLPARWPAPSAPVPAALEVRLPPPKLALAVPLPLLSKPAIEPRRPPPPRRAPSRPPVESAQPPAIRPAEAPAEPVPPPAMTIPAVAASTPDLERLLAAAPPAAGPPPRPPAEADPAAMRAGLDGYTREISVQLTRHRSYPPLAQLRGWEGTATLRLHLSAEGRLREAAVASSSGREILDRQALAMVQRLSAWPPPPPALQGRDIVVLVPVVFRLEN